MRCIMKTVHLKNFQRFLSSGRPTSTDVVFSDGRKITCKTGSMARLADGSSLVQAGDTAVLATAVCKNLPASLPSRGFVPLSVEYRQKAAAAGRIPMNFLRREMAPSSHEILTARLIDRSIRPLFPSNLSMETQVICTLLSADAENESDVLSVNAASLALAISDVPWSSPSDIVGAVRVGLINGKFVTNPTRSELKSSSLNLLLTATSSGNIMMLEGSAKELNQSRFAEALEFGVIEASKAAAKISKIATVVGKAKKSPPVLCQPDDLLLESVYSLSATKLKDIFLNSKHDKLSRDAAIGVVREEILNLLAEQSPSSSANTQSLGNEAFSQISKKIFRKIILDKGIRCDGRGINDLRPISCEVDMFAPLHGSAIFQRGQSQVMATVTFDSQEAAFRPDPAAAMLMGLREKNFMLHYEFPPFATSEMGRIGVSRREIGHGALAERSLRPVIPENYPFTIRITAEVLESNGSTSMAAACAGSLALMDSGVPICRSVSKKNLSGHVAGVAMGLITDEDKHVILTDQVGIEDYMGDMDFKIAGTLNGITGFQADTKLSFGLPLDVAVKAIDKGSFAIARTIDVMAKTLKEPREERKPWSPVSDKFCIPVSRRSYISGYNLRKLCQDTGVTLTPLDESTYSVFAPNPRCLTEAKEKFSALLSKADSATGAPDLESVLQFGAIYKVKIVELKDFGVLVEFPKSLVANASPILIHNSQLDTRKVGHPSALGLQVGMEISVKYFGRDPTTGNIRLSRKVLFVGIHSNSLFL